MKQRDCYKVMFVCGFLWAWTTVGAQLNGIDLTRWRAEDESGKLQTVMHGDTLELVVPGGLTFWYDERLTGEYEVSYRVCLLMQGGATDRLSDLNCFWAANDPLYPNDLHARATWRNGVFKRYNTLNLFYVGFGGNHNTTTRFRRYRAAYYGVDDEQVKPLIGEYTDAPHLLAPNRWYAITIRVADGYTTYAVDGEVLFRCALQPGWGDGHFGLRLLQNHLLMTDFKRIIL